MGQRLKTYSGARISIGMFHTQFKIVDEENRKGERKAEGLTPKSHLESLLMVREIQSHSRFYAQHRPQVSVRLRRRAKQERAEKKQGYYVPLWGR